MVYENGGGKNVRKKVKNGRERIGHKSSCSIFAIFSIENCASIGLRKLRRGSQILTR